MKAINVLFPGALHGFVVFRWTGLLLSLYKRNIVWHKVRKDTGPDRRGVGFYFRNVTEMILFGVATLVHWLPGQAGGLGWMGRSSG